MERALMISDNITAWGCAVCNENGFVITQPAPWLLSPIGDTRWALSSPDTWRQQNQRSEKSPQAGIPLIWQQPI